MGPWPKTVLAANDSKTAAIHAGRRHSNFGLLVEEIAIRNASRPQPLGSVGNRKFGRLVLALEYTTRRGK